MAVFSILSGLLGLVFWGAVIWWVVTRITGRNKKTRAGARGQRSAETSPEGEEIRMKETMLEQMNSELEKTGQTDTTVNIVGMLLNLVFLGANTGVGAAAHEPKASLAIKLVFFVLTAFVLVLNVSVGYALMAGKKRRVKIIERLEMFWTDQGMGKYQDESAGTGYAIRGNLFTIITMSLGVIAILISFIAFFAGF